MSTNNSMIDFTPVSPLAAPPPAVVDRIRLQPECRLLWAVMENAVEAYMKHVAATGRRGRRLFREAEEWIMRDDPTWLCSFVSICHVLGLDPDYVRSGITRWRETKVMPTFKQAA
jgi:hypothetical protein